MAPTLATLRGAKQRLKDSKRVGFLECIRERDGTYRIDTGAGRVTARRAMEAWLYAGDLLLGAIDEDGLADG